ncbi:sulfite exporter TauE/SafE family protein [Pollutimonas sp. H1-120]|uniref:sulfite exporter TauE/SafE family protein n=1 Tax=Pollutimonas sp. H1-120 TaxID=3148824 RepID=UPI003B523B85
MMLSGGLLGLVIGAVLGLTGAGGGIFAVPALVFGLGMDMRAAAPLALMAVGSAAMLGALQGLRQGLVRYKAAIVLATAGTITAPLGIRLAHWLPSRWLSLIFVAVMFVVAYRMFMSSRGAQNDGELPMVQSGVCKVSKETGRFIWNPRTVTTLGGIGVVSGLFTGMLGVGGGFIIVPALGYFSELRMHSIVATSLLVIALLSVVTVFIASEQGLLLTAGTWAFSAATLAGMAGARLLVPKISSTVLQRVFAIACVVVAAMMLMRNIG